MTPCFIVKSYMNRSNNKGVIQLTANLKCTAKAELLQLKPHPFICMRNFINKKVVNRKN